MSMVEDANDLTSQISEILFGANRVVTCEDSKLQPHLLEINSEQLFSWPALGN